MRLTKLAIDKLSPPHQKDGRTGQKRYYDENLKGFGLRVTSGGTKAFFVEKLINHKLRRITLGHYPALTVEQARKEAQKILGKIATGIDPIAEKKAKKIKSITLKQALDDYIKTHNSLKPSTIKDYERALNQVAPDWLNKPLTNITKELIMKRHAQHGQDRSKARANLAMRLLRAIFNFAINQYQTEEGTPIIIINPIKYLSHARSWYRIERRKSIIRYHQLADWYKGLMQLSEHYSHDTAEMWQDYFLLVLFTGMRRHEAASLRWEDIDLKAKSFTLYDTKNRDSHTLPMSNFIYELFLRRQKTQKSEFVFPATSRTGYIVEPRKAMFKVTKLAGVEFIMHDLRRTFITTAESLNIPAYALKRLLNHKMNNDVTAGYIMTDIERLRKPMQQITDFLLTNMNINNFTPAPSSQKESIS